IRCAPFRGQLAITSQECNTRLSREPKRITFDANAAVALRQWPRASKLVMRGSARSARRWRSSRCVPTRLMRGSSLAHKSIYPCFPCLVVGWSLVRLFAVPGATPISTGRAGFDEPCGLDGASLDLTTAPNVAVPSAVGTGEPTAAAATDHGA